MDNLFAGLKDRIPANKFYPPPVAAPRSVLRRQLLRQLDFDLHPNRNTVFLEAQAGQGKTTLAAQYLAGLSCPSLWYQVGEEDNDPLFLLTALLTGLKTTLPGFTSELLERMIISSELVVLESKRYINILLNDLAAQLRQPLVVVVDDLHLMAGAGLSLALVDQLLATAPPGLRFLLLSRFPVDLEARSRKSRQGALRLDNRALAMSRAEAAELLTDKMQLPLPEKLIRQVYGKNGGWPMGLVLAGHAMQDRLGQGALPAAADLVIEAMPGYFRQEVMSALPEELRCALYGLALLDEIPVALAEQLTGRPEIGAELLALHRRNFFIRPLDQAGTVFGLHHLFKEYLRSEAASLLPKERVAEIHRLAAAHCQDQEQPLKAMQALLAAGDVEAIEALLAREGMALLAMGRQLSLASLLERLDLDASGPATPWILFYKGMAAMDLKPQRALALFRQANGAFIAQQDERGELFAASMQVFYHMMCDGLFSQAEGLLERADQLFERIAGLLDPYSLALVARNLAYGFCFLEVDEARVEHYIDLAIGRLEGESVNLAASLRVIRGYTALGLGNRENGCVAEIEQIHRLARDPEVSFMNGLSILALQLNLLEQQGDFAALGFYRQILLESFEQDVVSETIFGPFLLIWELNMLSAGGDTDEVLKVVRQGSQKSAAHLQPHLYSQYLHYRAYALAQQGSRDKALAAARESRRLRGLSGGKYFIALNDLFVGASFILLGEHEQAASILDRKLHRRDEALALYQEAIIKEAQHDEWRMSAEHRVKTLSRSTDGG